MNNPTENNRINVLYEVPWAFPHNVGIKWVINNLIFVTLLSEIIFLLYLLFVFFYLSLAKYAGS